MKAVEYDYLNFNPALILHLAFSGQVDTIISGAEQFMMQTSADLIKVELTGPHTIDDLIKAGFMPTYIADNTKTIFQYDTWILIDHYIEGFSPAAIRFWFDERGGIEEAIGKSSHQWYFYASIKGWKEFAMRTSISFPLLMYAKDQVYQSRRPKTDMLMFRQATSAVYDRVQPEGPQSRLVIGDSFRLRGLPVTRYAAGMSKGLYYNDQSQQSGSSNDDPSQSRDKGNFCGTFYYFEPESATYLTFNTFAVFKNKHEAIKALIGGGNHAEFSQRAVDRYYNESDYPDYKFPQPDLMMTPAEYMTAKYSKDQLLEFDEPFWLKAGDRKHYVGRHLELYGVEDDYDQELCKKGRELGLDVIILAQMVGAFQLVTEILDTRDRLVSFSNLTFPRV